MSNVIALVPGSRPDRCPQCAAFHSFVAHKSAIEVAKGIHVEVVRTKHPVFRCAPCGEIALVPADHAEYAAALTRVMMLDRADRGVMA